MLTREEFLVAMSFFDEYDQLNKKIEESTKGLFDGNGIIFIGNQNLLTIHLKTLCAAMNIEYEPKGMDGYKYSNEIEHWCFECDDRIVEYGEPNEQGMALGKVVGRAPQKFWDTKAPDGKKFHITDNNSLYDYLEYCYNIQ